MTTTLSVPLSRMPVFVRAGAIIPEQSPSTTSSPTPSERMVLKVFSGSSGKLSLYADRGTGLGYTKGQYAATPITDTVGSSGKGGAITTNRVTVGSARGHYPGEPTAVGYRIEMVDLTQPSQVTLNGDRLAQLTSGSDAPGWYYQEAGATVVVNTPSGPPTGAVHVVAMGSRPVNRPEPPAQSS
jgi:hypothetical protein